VRSNESEEREGWADAAHFDSRTELASHLEIGAPYEELRGRVGFDIFIDMVKGVRYNAS
jgi:hypothetical protein